MAVKSSLYMQFPSQPVYLYINCINQLKEEISKPNRINSLYNEWMFVLEE